MMEEEKVVSKFYGSALGYIGWTALFVVLIFSGIGLLLYPWAKNSYYRWEVEKTKIDNEEYYFTGTPLSLFIVWVYMIIPVVFAILVVIATFVTFNNVDEVVDMLNSRSLATIDLEFIFNTVLDTFILIAIEIGILILLIIPYRLWRRAVIKKWITKNTHLDI